MPEPVWIYLMVLLYFTNMTTCSAIADAFDSVSHDRLTRMLQGTWAGHILLDLALRLLFTVAGGYLIVDDTVVAKPTHAASARPPGSGRTRPVKCSLACRSGSWSGRTARAAFPSPSACGTKGAPPSMIWPWSCSVMPAIGSGVSPLLSSLTPGTPPRNS